MVAAGERRIAEIAVVGDAPAPVTPCGACRQRIREFGDAATRSTPRRVSGARRSFTLDELLPEALGPDALPGAKT